MAMPTLMDIATRNAADLTIELLDEAVQYAPEVALGPARTIRGRQYKTLVRTANPTVSFRDANEGSAISKGTCLLYTSPSPRDGLLSRMPSSA